VRSKEELVMLPLWETATVHSPCRATMGCGVAGRRELQVE
jgi:hypothetical protein